MASISKLRKTEEGNDGGIDRINTLPISLLHHILSFLPTITCVGTISLVSPKWRYLWKDLQVFDFDDTNYPYDGDNAVELFSLFSVFVNTVLARRRSCLIRKFRLSCYHLQPDTFSTNSVASWIGTAVGPHLQEFDLTFFAGVNNLPLTLFYCPNLVSLRLQGKLNGIALFQLQDSSQICLPSLKVLQLLLRRNNLDMNSVNILLSRCPILENLELYFRAESLAKLRVSSSSLKWLKIDVENEVETCLEINAPGLKYLNLTMVTLGIVVANSHNVEEAYLDLSTSESKSVEPLLNLLRALSGIKHLELLTSTTQWLFAAPALDFPEFCYLLHLDLELPFSNSTFLFNMLQKCPMQTIIIFFGEGDPSYDLSPSYRWETKSTSVPKCLVSRLTFIHFQRFPVNELEFIVHVLQNGLVLKTMIVDVDDYWFDSVDQQKEWLKKISDLPRGSAMCEVKFNDATSR